MRQPIENTYTFDEFIDFLQTQPENVRYELYDGEIIQMPLATGKHEEIIIFLSKILTIECYRLNLDYGVTNNTLVKPENIQSGYFPDVLLLNSSNLTNEPRWEKESIISKSESIILVIEVVSTNWRDDYYKKLADYEEMGIQEYWIVDYCAYGHKEFTGKPKQPTLTIHFLEEDEYTAKRFRGNDRVESPTFPELKITAQEIFNHKTNQK